MNTKLFAFLILLASFTTTLSAWAEVAIPNSDCPSELTGDVTIDVGGQLVLHDSIDIKGNTLKLTGITDMSGEFEITDSVGGGVLDIEVTQKVTQSGTFGGKLKFIKRGAGELSVSMNQSYEGGTEIHGGSLYPKATKPTAFSNDEYNPYGNRASTIKIYSPGVLNVRAPTGWAKNYPIELYGGAISNIQTRSGGSFTAQSIKLYEDSVYFNNNNYGLAATFDLNGHELTIKDEYKEAMSFSPKFENAGTVVICGSKTMTLGGDISMPNASLRAEQAVNLNGKIWTVLNYESRRADVASYEGTLNVKGIFTPTSDNFFPPTMQDGSTIDLSAKEGPWAAGDTAFADGATIAIEVGERTDLTEGSLLVTWVKPEYNGRTFNLTSSGVVKKDLALQAQAGGLVVVSTSAKTPTAVWKGGNSADALDPENWEWRDAEGHPALPDGTYVVEIAWDKLPELNWPETDRLDYASLVFTGEKPAQTVALAGDRDWRGLGGMDVPYPLDLAGHTLAMTFKSGASAEACEVSSSAEGGVLIASVAEGKSYENALVTLSGALTLVKEGEGVFVAAKYPQEYTGVTIVSNGVLRCAVTNLNEIADKSPFGARRIVNVAPDGILDPAGSWNWAGHVLNLDGGAISNTVAQRGVGTTAYNVAAANYKQPFNPRIVLLADSTFATTKEFNFNGEVEADGHELEIWIASGQCLLWVPKAAENAVFVVTNGGYLKTLKNHKFNQPTATLKFTGGTVDLAGDVTVGDYYVSTPVSVYQYDTRADLKMKVSGTFTPVSENFFGCQLQSGSKVDLSACEGVWSTKSAMTNTDKAEGQGECPYVTFAENATVTVDVHGRTFKGRTQIVKWAQGSTNGLDTINFVLDAASKSAGYRLFYEPYAADTEDGGLYIGRKCSVLFIQ